MTEMDLELQELRQKLKAYEDTGLTPDAIIGLCEMDKRSRMAKMLRWEEAEKDGRLVVLPCKDVTVYTIKEDYFNCDICVHKSEARYDPIIQCMSCGKADNHCPFYIKEHNVSGFMISFAEGKPILSAPGEWGFEGLEPFSGIDGKWHLTREEAEAAMKGGSNETDSV